MIFFPFVKNIKQELFDSFLLYCNDNKLELPDKHYLYYYSEHEDSPFSIFDPYIYFNTEIWRKHSLSEYELFALLAHEIGHSIDTTDRNKRDEREVNADIFAIQLGFKTSLISGLQKLIDSGDYSEEENANMSQRIAFIRELEHMDAFKADADLVNLIYKSLCNYVKQYPHDPNVASHVLFIDLYTLFGEELFRDEKTPRDFTPKTLEAISKLLL